MTEFAEVRPTGPGSDRRRWLVLAICCLSLLIVGLDTTIVNVALPAIHRSLQTSVSGLQWTIDAYTLVLAGLVILSGSMADRFGRRHVFQIGLVGFSAGSLLCGLAPSLPFLIGARVLQAIGGSMLNPVAMSIIRNVFEEPRSPRSRTRSSRDRVAAGCRARSLGSSPSRPPAPYRLSAMSSGAPSR